MFARLALPLPLLAALAAPLTAQTGPWADGELVVAYDLGSFQYALQRIDPQTGAGATLTTVRMTAGPGKLAFDPHREGLLIYGAAADGSVNQSALRLVGADGGLATLGLLQTEARAIAPASDGRIFYRRHDAAAKDQIHWLDAANVAHVLYEADGVTPVVAPLDHLIYVPAVNALVGSRASNQAGNCATAPAAGLRRFPLTADGTRLAGPATCHVWDAGGFCYPNGFDGLPGNAVLMSVLGGDAERLVHIDPSTMSMTPWALVPDVGDHDGAAWSVHLGRTVLLDDWNNTLRTYAPGGSTPGVELVATVPVSSGSSGYGTTRHIVRVHLLPVGCASLVQVYGIGLAGLGGFVPQLAAVGCPDIGEPFALTFSSVRGGAPGAVFVGSATGTLPWKGGTFYPANVALMVNITVGGPAGEPGAGFLSLPSSLDPPSLQGIDLHFQAAFIDSGAVKGISLTNALRIQPG